MFEQSGSQAQLEIINLDGKQVNKQTNKTNSHDDDNK